LTPRRRGGDIPTPAPKDTPAERQAVINGHRKVAEMTDIPCDHDGCAQYFWKNYSPDGRQSWLSHRSESGEWHKPQRGGKA